MSDVLVTNFFFGVPREQHSNQGHNFELKCAKHMPSICIPSQMAWWKATLTFKRRAI
jgi:hypothetical protein